MRPEPFKEVCSAAGFMSQRETSVGTRNNILLVSNHDRELRQFFFFMFQKKTSVVYCNNITGLVKSMGLEYVTDLRIFIDSSSTSLKAVLQHNGNCFSSTPIEYSVGIKETHNSMDYLLSSINYQEHKWLICGDLKWLDWF